MNTNWMRNIAAFGIDVDNPFMRAVGAGATTAILIARTTAFAPVGAVGAGWGLVYAVTGCTLTCETVQEFVDYFGKTSEEKQREFERELSRLEDARDKGAITEEEFSREVKSLMSEYGSFNGTSGALPE